MEKIEYVRMKKVAFATFFVTQTNSIRKTLQNNKISVANLIIVNFRKCLPDAKI